MNGCFNRDPFKERMYVQDGWRFVELDVGKTFTVSTKIPNMVEAPFRMSKNCEYKKHDKYNDPNCVGCKHKEDK